MPESPNPLSTVEDVLRRWPRASEAFLQRRLACPGCAMAPFDTLRDVATAYGIDLPKLLDEVGRAAVGGRPQD